MAPNRNILLAEMRGLFAAIEANARDHDARALAKSVRALGAWLRRLILDPPETSQALLAENVDLRQKLRSSKVRFDSMVGSYKGILDAFETFRGTIDLVQQIKRLDEVPDIISSIRRLRSLHTLHLILDQDLFEGRVPAEVTLVPGARLRNRLVQFSPTPHAPRLFLGDVQHIEHPGFFLGLDQDPPAGSCFIFALGHKYQQGKTIGVVAAYDPAPERYAPDKATDFLSHFCDILANTLITALEHAQLEELTVRDALTGVNNRAYLERHAGRILDFAVRKRLPVHLLFIDLNGFKAVNDTHGHDAGDLVLIEVARAIQAMVRKYDIFVRLGGDEFVILLPDTEADMARSFVTRLRRTLLEIDVSRVCGQDTSLRVSASVGLSRYRPGLSLEDMIRDADQNMYADKSNHRSEPFPAPGNPDMPSAARHRAGAQ